MSQPAQNQQHTKPSTTPKSNPPQPDNNNKPDAFAELAEALVSAQAYLNNPKAEKTSVRREPVHLVPDLNSLPRPANQPQDAASFASSLPKAAFDPPARSAVSSSRVTGHASRATSHRPRTPRVSTVRQAKNYLRASRSPAFLRSAPDLQRHRRKCAICRHPEREMIEELFIHWHSPAAIANFFREYEEINWVSIYRHAYAFGLDQIRRRNLHHFFENLLDDAIEATPTFSGVLGAARALACVTEDGRWVEPEKRITMTTLVRHEDPSATSTTDPDSVDSKSEENVRVPSSLLPQAAFHNPAAASQTPPSGQSSAARRNESVAASATSLPEAALHSPAAACPEPRRGAKRTPPPGSSGVVRSGSREIRLSPNSHKTKDKTISNR